MVFKKGTVLQLVNPHTSRVKLRENRDRNPFFYDPVNVANILPGIASDNDNPY